MLTPDLSVAVEYLKHLVNITSPSVFSIAYLKTVGRYTLQDIIPYIRSEKQKTMVLDAIMFGNWRKDV